jgi:hypothetical protein
LHLPLLSGLVCTTLFGHSLDEAFSASTVRQSAKSKSKIVYQKSMVNRRLSLFLTELQWIQARIINSALGEVGLATPPRPNMFLRFPLRQSLIHGTMLRETILMISITGIKFPPFRIIQVSNFRLSLIKQTLHFLHLHNPHFSLPSAQTLTLTL